MAKRKRDSFRPRARGRKEDSSALPLEAIQLREIFHTTSLTRNQVSQLLGTSLASLVRWERGDTRPSSQTATQITTLLSQIRSGNTPHLNDAALLRHAFPSRGARRSSFRLPLFSDQIHIQLAGKPESPATSPLRTNDPNWQSSKREELAKLLQDHTSPAQSIDVPSTSGISAGKNTYTYDAHTYHTKVPPQGIAEILRQYLPQGGLVLDPFAGSGMTGVATRALGYDSILNELSPAASFIAEQFTTQFDPEHFDAGVRAVCCALRPLRESLYTTTCRECSKPTEILFTVWSYRVRCYLCGKEFLLWDHCRHYGKRVRDHKILSEFVCPGCGTTIKKSRLSRIQPEPVLLGYKCCGPQVEHPLTQDDVLRLQRIEQKPPLAHGFYPTKELPEGVNLGQPKRHGITSIDRFYTPRNLAAMSHLWRTIHRVTDPQLARLLAFVFTSLYQRVTKLSEFRFWGGSGNTANFNVPYISNEANVFITFERKALTIRDHLDTTARNYSGRCIVRTGSATDLHFIPSDSIDLVFTDPPFGANINYSEMNILWESWLGVFTDTTEEAIVNKVQNKRVAEYENIMQRSLTECYRVIRPGHWLLLVFMNSSKEVWGALRRALLATGFSLERIDIFDKHHGTFKQFVSENTAGSDLILHCRKPKTGIPQKLHPTPVEANASITSFLDQNTNVVPRLPYIHVERQEEIDYRMLYSRWLSAALINGDNLTDFTSFRKLASKLLERQQTTA